MKILSKVDTKDLVLGASILGTGGGDNPKDGLNLLFKWLDSGRKLVVVDVNELDEKLLVACTYYCGA